MPLGGPARILTGRGGAGVPARVGEGGAMRGNGRGRAAGRETVFTMEATPLKYGPGAAEEVGWG